MIEVTEHICTHQHPEVSVYSVDPTHTTMLRKAFALALRKRFNELTRVIRETVYTNDAFGLNPGMKMKPFTFQMNPAPADAFAFPRSKDKIAEFMKWLQVQVNRGILEIGELPQVGTGIEDAWTNKYVFDSYKRGVIRARYEMQKAGFGTPDIASTGGIEVSMNTPFHIDRLGLLYTRTYSELKGITAIMDQQISRVLAQGLANGDGPLLLARKLVSVVNGVGRDKLGLDISYTTKTGKEVKYFMPARRRAEIMARTEIIRAHHQATIMEYKNWAVEGIKVKAEFMTAGDNRVCPQCAMLEGEIFTLEEAMNLIPVHPSCRCIALPYKVK